MLSDKAKCVTLQAVDSATRGVADAHDIGQHRRKHRLQVAGGTADDFEYF